MKVHHASSDGRVVEINDSSSIAVRFKFSATTYSSADVLSPSKGKDLEIDTLSPAG